MPIDENLEWVRLLKQGFFGTAFIAGLTIVAAFEGLIDTQTASVSDEVGSHV